MHLLRLRLERGLLSVTTHVHTFYLSYHVLQDTSILEVKKLFIDIANLLSCMCLFFLIFRAPDIAKVRHKMVYASSKDRFKRELDGVQVELQATDPSEMSLDIIKSRAL